MQVFLLGDEVDANAAVHAIFSDWDAIWTGNAPPPSSSFAGLLRQLSTSYERLTSQHAEALQQAVAREGASLARDGLMGMAEVVGGRGFGDSLLSASASAVAKVLVFLDGQGGEEAGSGGGSPPEELVTAFAAAYGAWRSALGARLIADLCATLVDVKLRQASESGRANAASRHFTAAAAWLASALQDLARLFSSSHRRTGGGSDDDTAAGGAGFVIRDGSPQASLQSSSPNGPRGGGCCGCRTTAASPPPLLDAEAEQTAAWLAVSAASRAAATSLLSLLAQVPSLVEHQTRAHDASAAAVSSCLSKGLVATASALEVLMCTEHPAVFQHQLAQDLPLLRRKAEEDNDATAVSAEHLMRDRQRRARIQASRPPGRGAPGAASEVVLEPPVPCAELCALRRAFYELCVVAAQQRCGGSATSSEKVRAMAEEMVGSVAVGTAIRETIALHVQNRQTTSTSATEVRQGLDGEEAPMHDLFADARRNRRRIQRYEAWVATHGLPALTVHNGVAAEIDGGSGPEQVARTMRLVDDARTQERQQATVIGSLVSSDGDDDNGNGEEGDGDATQGIAEADATWGTPDGVFLPTLPPALPMALLAGGSAEAAVGLSGLVLPCIAFLRQDALAGKVASLAALRRAIDATPRYTVGEGQSMRALLRLGGAQEQNTASRTGLAEAAANSFVVVGGASGRGLQQHFLLCQELVSTLVSCPNEPVRECAALVFRSYLHVFTTDVRLALLVGLAHRCPFAAGAAFVLRTIQLHTQIEVATVAKTTAKVRALQTASGGHGGEAGASLLLDKVVRPLLSADHSSAFASPLLPALCGALAKGWTSSRISIDTNSDPIVSVINFAYVLLTTDRQHLGGVLGSLRCGALPDGGDQSVLEAILSCHPSDEYLLAQLQSPSSTSGRPRGSWPPTFIDFKSATAAVKAFLDESLKKNVSSDSSAAVRLSASATPMELFALDSAAEALLRAIGSEEQATPSTSVSV